MLIHFNRSVFLGGIHKRKDSFIFKTETDKALWAMVNADTRFVLYG